MKDNRLFGCWIAFVLVMVVAWLAFTGWMIYSLVEWGVSK